MLKSQLFASFLIGDGGRCVRPITNRPAPVLFPARTNRTRKPYAHSWPTGSKKAGTVMNPAKVVTPDKCADDAVFINTTGGWVKGCRALVDLVDTTPCSGRAVSRAHAAARRRGPPLHPAGCRHRRGEDIRHQDRRSTDPGQGDARSRRVEQGRRALEDDREPEHPIQATPDRESLDVRGCASLECDQ